MRNRAIKAASLVIAFVGTIIALFGVLVLLFLLTDPPADVGLVGFIIVLILISLFLGAAILVGGGKLFASAGKKTERETLANPNPSQQMKADSDNPSQTDTGLTPDVETVSPGMRTIYCPNCGTESKESANFCRDCGQALSAEEETTHDSGLVSAAKSQESSDTLAGYMSAKIQKMEAGAEAAPSSSPSSKSDATKKIGGESEGDAGKNQKKADSQPKVGSGYKEESEPTNRDKLLGCAVIGAIILGRI